jgi:hypothetical protein
MRKHFCGDNIQDLYSVGALYETSTGSSALLAESFRDFLRPPSQILCQYQQKR